MHSRWLHTNDDSTTIKWIYASSSYKVCSWTHLLWRRWVGGSACVFVLALGWLNNVWVTDIRAVLSEGILWEQRAPTFAWNDKKVCRQEGERESNWEKERACSMLPLIRVSSLQIQRTIMPVAINTHTHTHIAYWYEHTNTKLLM